MPFDGSLNVDWSEVDHALGDVELRAKRLAPAWRQLRRPMRQDQGAHAKAEEGPTGRWAPRSPLTEARRKASNRRLRVSRATRTIALGKFPRRPTPKRILGRLPGALVVTVGDLFIRASSRIPVWPGAHQQGDHVGHHRRVALPQRIFLWLGDSLLNTASSVLGQYVLKGWKR